MLCRFIGVDEAGGPFHGHGLDRGPELQDQDGRGRLGGVVDDVSHCDGVDAGFGGCLAAGEFPDARGAVGVGVGCALEFYPVCGAGGEVGEGGDFGG